MCILYIDIRRVFFWCIVFSVGYLHRGACFGRSRLWPCTPWLSCRFTKPRRSNRCTRVVGERRPVTSSRSRCWCTGAWSNAFSPRIGLQRSTWRTLTFTFRSFCDTDRSTVCVRRSGMAVQGPPLRAFPVSPCVHEGCRGRPYPVTGSGRWDPQLPRRLAYPSTIQWAVGRSQGLGAPAPQPVGASGQLGKEQAPPVQRISFLGVELDSVSMMARLTEERAQAVLNCLSSFRGKNVVPLKQFQRLLVHMASAAAVTPLGLLHMRPLQHWLHSRVPRWAWCHGTLQVDISQQCHRSLSPWTDLAFLRAGVPLEQVSRHTVVTTDASSTGWGATCNGQAASGLWTGPRLLWHINCLELWAVHLALRQFRPLMLGKHVLVRTDNTAAVSYINRLGGIRSHRMSQLARHLLLWSHTQFKSLRAVHIPGQLNRVANALSRQLTFPGEWRLHPETIRLIWPIPPTASCTSPWPRIPSAQTHWHIAGLGPYASMRFPQWAYSHRHCASSGRPRSRSCWLRPIGPPGPGFPNSFSSQQHLPGAFLWGRTSFLRSSAPYGTPVQIYGTSMCGSWTGRGRLEWSTTGGGRDHHSG